MNEPKASIRKFVIETFLFGQESGLTDHASFLANGVVDSTGVIELVAHLEQIYRIKIPDTDLLPENLDSINAIAAYLTRRGVAVPAA
jgi:acyl carrier protein